MKYIGVDLGGTKVAAASFSKNIVLQRQERVLLDGREAEDVADLIYNTIISLLNKKPMSEPERVSIGISVPGIAYSKSGDVWAPNIPGWERFPLQKYIKERIPEAEVTIESERTCYILGEAAHGAAKGCNNAVFMAVGTGIGVGILIDGRVLHGADDIVGAAGWMALSHPFDQSYIATGCFESQASGEGLALQAKRELSFNNSYDGILSKMALDEICSRTIFSGYETGDPICTKVIDKAIELWGMAAANLVSLLNPEMVIFGGGVFGPASKFVERIYSEALKWAQPISIKKTIFRATELPDDAGLYGAGAVAVRNSYNKSKLKLN